MDNNGLIGYTGFVGSVVESMFKFDSFYNRSNIYDLPKNNFDLLVCAAPTGIRLFARKNPMDDLDFILLLIDHLRKTKIKNFILLSTIDVIAKPNTIYGMNRKILEGWVKTNVDNYSIIRMPTLIHPDIKKNILYDLKHKQWLEKLNPESTVQYYDLTKLKTDINYAIDNDIQELNLFSEPIKNQEVVDRFFSGTQIGAQCAPVQTYDIKPQMFNKQEIFASMEKYFNEVPVHLW